MMNNYVLYPIFLSFSIAKRPNIAQKPDRPWPVRLESVLLGAFAVVKLCKAAFTGFAEAVIQMDAGLLHGPADHVIADVSPCQGPFFPIYYKVA